MQLVGRCWKLIVVRLQLSFSVSASLDNSQHTRCRRTTAVYMFSTASSTLLKSFCSIDRSVVFSLWAYLDRQPRLAVKGAESSPSAELSCVPILQKRPLGVRGRLGVRPSLVQVPWRLRVRLRMSHHPSTDLHVGFAALARLLSR